MVADLLFGGSLALMCLGGFGALVTIGATWLSRDPNGG